MAEVDTLLLQVVELGASDLHVTAGQSPYVRLRGEMKILSEWEPLPPESTHQLIHEIMPPEVAMEFDRAMDVDFGYTLENGERFRVNVFCDQTGSGFVMRHIACKVPTADGLGLPQAVRGLCRLPNGLVVVTGPTGSGKSTTLAAMIDLINSTRRDHVITIEDPVEFVHVPRLCLINQREVHSHTGSFAKALRAALREDPDVVMVGEMRDRETMECALELAETGHLVFGTLHTNTAMGTVSRIVDMFPAERQQQIRSVLADALRAVLAQSLCQTIAGGMTAAHEILMINSAIAANIRDGKYHYIESAMQTGRNAGMQTLNDALMTLVESGTISPETACRKALNEGDLKAKLKTAGFFVEGDGTGSKAEDSGAALHDESDADSGGEAVVQAFRQSLQEDEERIDVLNNLAWILATDPSPRVRNGAEATKLAARAFSLLEKGDFVNQIRVLDTLAAAYAETGHYKKAVQTVGKALDVARGMGREEVVDELQIHMDTYVGRRPMRSNNNGAPPPSVETEINANPGVGGILGAIAAR